MTTRQIEALSTVLDHWVEEGYASIEYGTTDALRYIYRFCVPWRDFVALADCGDRVRANNGIWPMVAYLRLDQELPQFWWQVFGRIELPDDVDGEPWEVRLGGLVQRETWSSEGTAPAMFMQLTGVIGWLTKELSSADDAQGMVLYQIFDRTVFFELMAAGVFGWKYV